MASQLFIELDAEHARLISLALDGNPPRDDLKNFCQRLEKSRKEISDLREQFRVEYFIMYWKGFRMQLGESEAEDAKAAINRRSRCF